MKKLVLLIVLCLYIDFASAAIIADHNAVIDFDQGNIPDYWIEQVKDQGILLQIPGRSHAQQIVGDLDGDIIQYEGGLRELMFLDSKYNVQIDCHYNDLISNNSLRILKGQFSGTSWKGYDYECRNDDDHYWSIESGRNHTIDSANEAIAQGDPIDGSIFGWSFHIIRTNSVHDENSVLITFNDERRDAYFNAMDLFSINAPETKYIYATAPTDDDSGTFIDKLGADGLRVTQYNQMIREEAISNDGILFDQADIENYDMNMLNPYQPTYNENILQVRHPEWDGSTGPHGKIELGIAKAKAIWWMSARMAGWDGTPACQSNDDCGGNDCIQGICQPNTVSIVGENDLNFGETYSFDVVLNLNEEEQINNLTLNFLQPNEEELICSVVNQSLGEGCEEIDLIMVEGDLSFVTGNNLLIGEYVFQVEAYVLSEGVENYYISENHTFIVNEVPPIQEDNPVSNPSSGGGGGGGRRIEITCNEGYILVEDRCIIDEIMEEDMGEDISEVSEEIIVEEDEIEKSSNFITGAVVTVEEFIESKDNITYFVALFVFVVLVIIVKKRLVSFS